MNILNFPFFLATSGWGLVFSFFPFFLLVQQSRGKNERKAAKVPRRFWAAQQSNTFLHRLQAAHGLCVVLAGTALVPSLQLRQYRKQVSNNQSVESLSLQTWFLLFRSDLFPEQIQLGMRSYPVWATKMVQVPFVILS